MTNPHDATADDGRGDNRDHLSHLTQEAQAHLERLWRIRRKEQRRLKVIKARLRLETIKAATTTGKASFDR